MSFIDDSEKNVKKLMKEVSGGSVGGFVGRAGMGIDDLFAGSFHPDSGHGSKNLELLTKQVKDRKQKRKDMEQKAYEDGVELVGNPDPIGGHFNNIGEIEHITLAFDELTRFNELNKEYNDVHTPEQQTEWIPVKTNLKYDKTPKYAGKNYINKSTTNWQYIVDDKEDSGVDAKTYQDTIDEDENFVNRSATNWQYIK